MVNNIHSSEKTKNSRRGRPPKQAKQENLEKKENNALISEKEVNTAPKKRGRKPKPKMELSPKAKNEAMESIFENQENIEKLAENTGVEQKRRRGRPARKNTLQNSANISSELTSITDDAYGKAVENAYLQAGGQMRPIVQKETIQETIQESTQAKDAKQQNNTQNLLDNTSKNENTRRYGRKPKNFTSELQKNTEANTEERTSNLNTLQQKFGVNEEQNLNKITPVIEETSQRQNSILPQRNLPQNQNFNDAQNFNTPYQERQYNSNVRNNQYNSRSTGQKIKNTRPYNSNSNYNEPVFDNSSVIAAITGQNFQHDAFEKNNYTNLDNSHAQKQRLAKQIPMQNSFKQPHTQHTSHALPSENFAETIDNYSPDSFSQTKATPKRRLPVRPRRHGNKQVNQNFQGNAYFVPDTSANSLVNQYKETSYPSDFTQNATFYPASAKKKQGEPLKMYVSVQPEEQVEVALVDSNKVMVEYFVEMAHQAKIRGNIYKATVHNVDPNLQAAFINFGSEKNGFLQIDEVHPDYYSNPHTPTKLHKFPLISKVLRPGQEILVQIVKEPTGSKGAFLTTWISLAGRFLVLTPGQEQMGVSRKVIDPVERERLRMLLDGIDPGKDMGIIVRTAAANATPEDIRADLEYLQRLWIDIVNRAHVAHPQTLIHQEVELTQRVVRDYLNEDVREIWTDDEEMAESISEMATLLYPQKRKIVKYHADPRQNIWDRFNLQDQINDITAREIELPSGGRVVFDQTEALMAIDINSGKTQNRVSFHSMVLQTNIEAAHAIARHLRLRDIGGQIVIDFIELREKSGIREVEKAFREGMLPDRARYEIASMSPFGLLEVVRQRIGSSAISISTEPCPHCNGTGVRRNMEWQAQDALKEIARNARLEKSIRYTYKAQQELALYLLNSKRDRIIELEEKLNKRIEIIF